MGAFGAGHILGDTVKKEGGTVLVLLVIGALVWAGGGCASNNEAVVDLVYHSGTIVTVDEDFSIVEALAIKEGRIVAVGSSDSMRKLASRGTRMVDLDGKTVLPGLHDSHVHLSFGSPANVLDLRHIDTVEDLQVALAEPLPLR